MSNDRGGGDGAIEYSTAEVTARATTPQERAGCHPSPGPPHSSDEHAVAGPADLLQMLDVMIVQKWAQTLTGPFDWADWPLAYYVFGEAFHQYLENRRDLDNVARTCAMVACGLAHEFCDLELKPRLAGAGGGALVREDGAGGYRCTIVSGRGAGSRLDFWRLPGVIEFATFTAMHLVRE